MTCIAISFLGLVPSQRITRALKYKRVKLERKVLRLQLCGPAVPKVLGGGKSQVRVRSGVLRFSPLEFDSQEPDGPPSASAREGRLPGTCGGWGPRERQRWPSNAGALMRGRRGLSVLERQRFLLEIARFLLGNVDQCAGDDQAWMAGEM